MTSPNCVCNVATVGVHPDCWHAQGDLVDTYGRRWLVQPGGGLWCWGVESADWSALAACGPLRPALSLAAHIGRLGSSEHVKVFPPHAG